MRGQSPFSLTPWVRGLLIGNAVVYLLTITVFTGSWFYDWFAFQPQRILARWWTPVSYMFVHGGFLHLAFNMLLLFVFGPAVEERLGSRRFGLYYLACGLGGAALSFGLLLATPVAMVYGSSGAVFGVALAFALFWPDAPIFVFPLPIPIKVKWLVLFLAAVNLVGAVLGTADGVAHLAHLGGFMVGFLWLKGERVLRQRARAVFARRPASVVPAVRRREAHAAPGVVAAPKSRSLDDEVDRLLDKISASGLDSLTPRERQLLDEVSRRLRQH